MGWSALDEILKTVTPILAWLGIVAGITLLLWHLEQGARSMRRVRGASQAGYPDGRSAPRRSLIAIVGVLLISLASGWVGFAGHFADASPGETLVQRSFMVVGIQVLGAMAIGVLLPKSWYFCVLAAWGSLLVFVMMPTPSFVFDTTPVQFPEDIISPNWLPLAAVVLAIATGYSASRARKTECPIGAERRWSWFVKLILALTITAIGYTWLGTSEAKRHVILKENTHKAQALWREITPRLAAGASEDEVSTFLHRNYPNYVKYQTQMQTEYRIPVAEEPASRGYGSWTAGVRLIVKDGSLVCTGIGRWSNKRSGSEKPVKCPL